MSKTKHRLAGSIEKELVEVPGREGWLVPTHWHWYELSRLITTSEIEIGTAALRTDDDSSEGTITAIFSEDLKNSKEIYAPRKITEQKQREKNLKIFTGEKLLVAVARDTTGRVGILAEGQNAVCNNVIAIITPNEQRVVLNFLYYYFRLEQTRYYIQKVLVSGRTYIPYKKMGKIKIPVPPLKEQQRIVERVETLTYDINRCIDQVQRNAVDTLITLYQAVTNAFAPLRIKRWSSHTLIQEVLSRNTSLLSQDTRLPTYAQYPYLMNTTIEPLTGRLLASVPLEQIQRVTSITIIENAHSVILFGKERTNKKQPEKQNGLAKQDELYERFASFPLVAMLQQAHVAYNHQHFLELTPNPQTEVLPRFLFWSLLADVVTLDGIKLSEGNVSESTIGKAMLRFPSKDEQEQIIRQLDALQNQVTAIRRKQDSSLRHLEELTQLTFERALQGKL